jgi:hypothetical protein
MPAAEFPSEVITAELLRKLDEDYWLDWDVIHGYTSLSARARIRAALGR